MKEVHDSTLKNALSDQRFLIVLLYMGASLLLLLNHEVWKDEAHHWLLAKDSDSILNLIKNSRYEGHPLLWNSILFLITRFTHNPLWMQLVHWAIAVSAIGVLTYKSHFPNWVKWMLPFSYLLLFEYQAVSRNYALCILLMFVVCTLLKKDRLDYFKLAIVLLLLANTHLFGLVFSSGVGLVVLFNHLKQKNEKLLTVPLISFSLICLVGFVLSVVQIIPPSDHFLTANHNDASLMSGTRINKLISTLFRGVFAVPDIWQEGPWNNNLFFAYIPDSLKAVMSILVWPIPFLVFRESKKVVLLFYFTAFSLSFFAYLSPLLLANRHSGFLFLVLICCCWLIRSKHFNEQEHNLDFSRYSKALFVMLSILIISSGMMASLELSRPFSESKNVASYIQDNGLEDLPIVSTQNAGVSLSAQLRKPLFYADKNDYGSYALWKTSSFELDRAKIESNIKAFAESQKEFLIATEYEHDTLFTDACWKVSKLKDFNEAIVPSERFVLYRVSRNCE